MPATAAVAATEAAAARCTPCCGNFLLALATGGTPFELYGQKQDTVVRDFQHTNTQPRKIHLPPCASSWKTDANSYVCICMPRLRLFGYECLSMNFSKKSKVTGIDRETQVFEADLKIAEHCGTQVTEGDLNFSTSCGTQVTEADLKHSAQKKRRVCVCSAGPSRLCEMHGHLCVAMDPDAPEFVPSSSSRA